MDLFHYKAEEETDKSEKTYSESEKVNGLHREKC